MPLAKCGACGKFLSPLDAAKCTKCSATYHRICVDLPAKGTLAQPWQCTECKKKVRRENKVEIAAGGNTVDVQAGEEGVLQVSPVAPVVTLTTAMVLPVSSARSPVRLTRSPALGTGLLRAVTPPPVDSSDVERASQDFPEDVGSALKLIMGEIRSLRMEVMELKNELKISSESCHTRMDGIEARLEALESRQADLPADANSVEGTISQLKRDLNDRDQELMANDLVIANLPESQAENPAHLVKLIASKLGLGLDDRDIVSAERIGSRKISATNPAYSSEPRPRAIMVRLARRDLRDGFLDGARVRRGATTEDLGLSGPARRFFINERLTKINQQLFHNTRAAAGLHGWRFVWTKRGRIMVRNKPGDASRRITSDEDIQQVIGPYTNTK